MARRGPRPPNQRSWIRGAEDLQSPTALKIYAHSCVMNICMMTNTYLPHVGGVARSVSTFTDEYDRRGHGVLVVAPEFEGKPLTKRAAALVERVPAIQNFNGSDFSVRLPIATVLSPRLDEFEADIVHAHHPFLLGDT